MNVLFLTYGNINAVTEHSIYSDLIWEFAKNGHDIYTISPSYLSKSPNVTYEHITQIFIDFNIVRGGNNMIKKGLSTIRAQDIFVNAIKKHYAHQKFDLVLYSTPPITLCKAVEYVKKRDHAKTYLLLKDIFPQNSIDIGLMSNRGWKKIIYAYFHRIEKKLYRISDCIGCMSQANVDYIINHNEELQSKRIEVCPNSIEVIDKSIDKSKRDTIREKYGIPKNQIVFVYGGNLGKPQGIPFIIDCLNACRINRNIYFLIVGDGSEYSLLERYMNKMDTTGLNNAQLIRRLPKEQYETLVAACDIGLIFLDHRFTIPNFPSRLLSYMQAKLPVLAATDQNTDIGKIIVEGGFGWWCESNNPKSFYKMVEKIETENLEEMGKISFDYLKDWYSVGKSYDIIMNSVSAE